MNESTSPNRAERHKMKKFTVSDYLTIAETKSEEFLTEKRILQEMTERDFLEFLPISGRLLKLEKVELVKDHNRIIPWVDFYEEDYGTIRRVSCEYYDRTNSFIQVFERK
jgi:hypothetical protein